MGFLISEAWAEAAAPSPMDTSSSLFMMLGIFVIFYLLIIRPQSKRAKEHKNLMSNLKKGDEVISSGGILGEITRLDEQFVSLSIEKGVEVIIQRQAINQVLPKGSIQNIRKEKEKTKE